MKNPIISFALVVIWLIAWRFLLSPVDTSVDFTICRSEDGKSWIAMKGDWHRSYNNNEWQSLLYWMDCARYICPDAKRGYDIERECTYNGHIEKFNTLVISCPYKEEEWYDCKADKNAWPHACENPYKQSLLDFWLDKEYMTEDEIMYHFTSVLWSCYVEDILLEH